MKYMLLIFKTSLIKLDGTKVYFYFIILKKRSSKMRKLTLEKDTRHLLRIILAIFQWRKKNLEILR